jgi:hypothetical protein
MSKEKEVIYEPHPVSAERKAELLGKGFKILDAVFAPADALPVDPVDGEDATKKQKPKG